jgi:two-component system sensor histidine kinase BaeS
VTERPLSPLGIRLAAAFVTVAVAAVAVFAVLTITSAREQLGDLVSQVHVEDTRAAAAQVAAAFEAAGSDWGAADLTSAVAVAARDQATIAVLDGSGAVVREPVEEAAAMLERMHGVSIVDTPRGDPVEAPVVVAGSPVGSVQLRFPKSSLSSPEQEVRDALVRTALFGALLAIAVAVAVSVFVAHRVSRPLTQLTAAATELEAGRRDVRVHLEDAPGELGTLAATFDRMAEAVQREDELRRQLIRDVAHEVRTPLTILRGTTEALVDGVMEPDDETLSSLHDEVLRLTRVVGDLETLAEAEASALQLEMAPIDLVAVAEAAVAVARAAAAAEELELVGDLSPAPAVGDAGRLGQVAVNLVVNALRYTPAGGAITVRTSTRDGEAVLEVLDTGPGIADEDLPHLFERFYRGRTAERTSGSGIGLAVASELAAAHGGRIEAANRPEGGAVFTVRLPGRA